MEAPPIDVEEQGGAPAAGAGESHPAVADIAMESSGKRKREEGEETPAAEPARHPMWKTSLCSFYRRLQKSGSCSHGDNCRYAHGEAELRPRPDNTWDPTSDRAKMLLKTDTHAAAAADDPPVTLDETALDKHITGLPKKWAFDNLKNFLDGKGISFKTAKKKEGMSIAFVAFENIEQVKRAVEVLNENSTGGNQIKVADANGASHDKKLINRTMHSENQTGVADPVILSSLNESDDVVGNDTSVVEGLASKARSARDVVTPLANMPYSDQLEHKKRSLSQILKRLTKNARKACPDAVPPPDWITNSRGIGGLPCKLEGILESPLVNGYRNKCEFSVGYSLQGKRTVGFTLGNFREGVTAVEEPLDCPNVSRIACVFASIFQKFLQPSSLPVWNKMDNTGFWRQFTVREGRDPSQAAAIETQVAEVMIIVQVCSSNVDEEKMKNEFQRMVQALAQGAAECSPPLPLTTVVVQDHKGISNAAPADCPLIVLQVPKVEGYSCSHDIEARIHDYISNLRFSISPTAFFQVNSLAAERLYSLAGDWANLTPDTLLFDICCGTGTIGLTLAHRVGMVVGIEMNNSAVSDAQRNAEINGINNCRFVCSKAEDVMGSLLKEYLDAPQQCEHDSDLSGIGSIDNGLTVANDVNDVEVVQDDASISANPATNSNAESSTCLEERTNKKRKVAGDCEEKSGKYTNPGESVTDCSAENGANDSIANHDPGHESVDSLEFLKGCTSEGSKSNQGNDSYENRKPTNSASTRHFKDVVAIVDPPRVGLHPVVIKALRTHPRIRRLVYISCNPASLVANAIELCTPTTDKPERGNGNRVWRNTSIAGLARNRAKSMPNSEPFVPVKAMAVDLFPHTPHCEMVMLLER